MNSREFKHEDTNAPPFSILNHGKNIKRKEKNYRSSWKWFSNVKTMNFYTKNYLCNEFKGIQT